MALVRDMLTAVDATDLRKAIERVAEKKSEFVSMMTEKAARAKELGQESLAKGHELASGIVNKARPLANIAIEKSTQLANRALQEPRVASAYAATKKGAQRVSEYVSANMSSARSTVD
mmetsp:Transcript_14625/g.25495  ORF Transcript_14625/g.25495 Transcript_14625/m.25495 type:complete len:118 (-) Transcript_14625:253-606(-)